MFAFVYDYNSKDILLMDIGVFFIWLGFHATDHSDGLVQERRNSSALAMEDNPIPTGL